MISDEDETIVVEPPWACRYNLKQIGCTAAAAAFKQTEETDIFEVDFYEPILCGFKNFLEDLD